MKEVYLDNNATTRPAPEVLEVMQQYLTRHYGNPSSLHSKGIDATRALKQNRQLIAEKMGVKPSTVIFTSGGTETNNLVLRGAAATNKKRGRHIVSTAVEHVSILETLHQLEEEGFHVTYVPPRKDGVVAAEAVAEALTDDTILVSVMHVNNETGSIFPIEEIAALVKAEAPSVIMHSDGVQGLGKVPVDLTHVDAYSVSGHKIHAPKGVGLLYLSDNTYIRPLFTGGGHERGWRSGTENVPGIAALGKAVQMAFDFMNSGLEDLHHLKKYFLEELKNRFDDLIVNSPQHSVPTTLNVSFPPIPGEVMVNALSEQNIYVSTGSACSSKKKNSSHVLKAMKRPQKAVNSNVRFSFSRYTQKEELDYTLQMIEKTIPRLKKVAQKTAL